MDVKKDIVIKILVGTVAAAIAYVASVSTTSPPIDLQLLIYLVIVAIALAIIWAANIQQRFVKSEEATQALDKRMNIQVGELMRSQQLLMRYRLLSDAREYIAQGFVASEDLELWLEMYASYEKLGKNGVLHEYHEKMVRLPVTYPKDKYKGKENNNE